MSQQLNTTSSNTPVVLISPDNIARYQQYAHMKGLTAQEVFSMALTEWMEQHGGPEMEWSRKKAQLQCNEYVPARSNLIMFPSVGSRPFSR